MYTPNLGGLRLKTRKLYPIPHHLSLYPYKLWVWTKIPMYKYLDLKKITFFLFYFKESKSNCKSKNTNPRYLIQQSTGEHEVKIFSSLFQHTENLKSKFFDLITKYFTHRITWHVVLWFTFVNRITQNHVIRFLIFSTWELGPRLFGSYF